MRKWKLLGLIGALLACERGAPPTAHASTSANAATTEQAVRTQMEQALPNAYRPLSRMGELAPSAFEVVDPNAELIVGRAELRRRGTREDAAAIRAHFEHALKLAGWRDDATSSWPGAAEFSPSVADAWTDGDLAFSRGSAKLRIFISNDGARAIAYFQLPRGAAKE